MVDQYVKKILTGSEELEKERAYWLTKLDAGMSVSRLLPDTGLFVSNKKGRIQFELPTEVSQRILQISNHSEKGVYIFLLAGINYLIYRYTGEMDILVGTPIFKKDYSEGLLNNLLFLRNQLDEIKSFKELLFEIKRTVGEADKYQNYPFTSLVDELNLTIGEKFTFNLILLLENIQNRDYIGADQPEMLFSFRITNGRILGTLEYNTALYHEETGNGFINNLIMFFQTVIKNPDISLAEIELVTREEREEIISKSTIQVDYPRDQTLHQLFEEQVAERPDKCALKLSDEEMTYQELNEQANRLARFLRQKGVTHEVIVSIMVKRSFEMVIGLLAILKAGGGYLPIDPDYPAERINYLLEDSKTNFLITDQTDLAHLSFSGEVIDIKSLQLDELDSSNLTNLNTPDHLAYIIYTSGSTGQPKGVMIEHRNVVRLLINEQIQFDFTEDDIWTVFHSFCFDFSVWEMFGALLYGGKLVIVSKKEAQNPKDFLKILRKERITVLNQTPTAFYNLSNQELKDQQKDLHVRYIIFGGEALNPLKIANWQKKYPETRLINMYGITETTVHVTFKELKADDLQSNTSNIGKPIPTLNTYIMDRNLKLQPVGVPGELCVGGEGVARGYLNRIQLTEEKFVQNPYNPTEKIYRSGDLVRMPPTGEMEYLGRIDRQVKIRGFRIELGEIESYLLKYPSIKDVVIVLKGDTEEKSLVAYIVSDEKLIIKDLRNNLSQDLPKYMIPAFFIQLAKMPLTPNGKINYKRLPDPKLAREENYLPPTTELEKRLAMIWFDTLGINEISVYDDFFNLGGHSLNATQLALRIEKEFDIEFPLNAIFNHSTIKELAEWIERAEKNAHRSIEITEEKDYYPLSSSQKRLYLVHQMNPESLNYNMFGAFTIEGELNLEAFKVSFAELIHRHESLRTSFHIVDGEPKQRVEDQVDFEVFYQELAIEDELNSTINNLIKPFVLANAPLIRVTILKTLDKNIMVLDMHHIISDGISMNIFARDMLHLYQGTQLPEMRIQYKDYAIWQNRYFKSEKMKKQKEYWLKHLENLTYTELPKNELISVCQPKGQSKDLILSSEITKQIERFCSERKVTKFTLLLAIFKMILAKKINQQDITVGIPIAGRNAPDLENIIGLFLNVLAIRADVQGSLRFIDYLAKIKEVVLEAYENQEYPYEELYSNIKKMSKWQPDSLFSILVNYMPFKKEGPKVNEKIRIRPYKNVNEIEAKYEVTLYILEREADLSLRMVYREDLIEMSLVEEILENMESVLETIMEDEQVMIGEIQLAQSSIVDGFSSNFDAYYD